MYSSSGTQLLIYLTLWMTAYITQLVFYGSSHRLPARQSHQYEYVNGQYNPPGRSGKASKCLNIRCDASVKASPFFFHDNNDFSKHPYSKTHTRLLRANSFMLQLKEFLQHLLDTPTHQENIVERPDGLPSIGLFLLNFFMFDIAVTGNSETLKIVYLDDKFEKTIQSMFKERPFKSHLEKAFAQYLKSVIPPDKFLSRKFYAYTKVAACAHLTSSFHEAPSASLFKTRYAIVISLAFYIERLHFSDTYASSLLGDLTFTLPNQQLHTTPSSETSLSEFWSSWVPAMLYQEVFLEELPQIETSLDQRLVTYVTKYRSLARQNVAMNLNVETCKDSLFFAEPKHSSKVKNVEYCIKYPSKLSYVEKIQIYLGLLPTDTLAMYYRLVFLQGRWHKILLLRQCLLTGWSRLQIVTDHKTAENKHRICRASVLQYNKTTVDPQNV